MKGRTRTSTAAVIVAALCAACIPHRLKETPQLSGTVTDARSTAPAGSTLYKNQRHGAVPCWTSAPAALYFGAETFLEGYAAEMNSLKIVKEACERAQEMIEAGAPPAEVLACLVLAAEIVSAPRATSSILVLDENGLLRNGASPNLPADYLRAIDRLKPDPRIGTCAAAAATGQIIVTRDFREDDKWAELRHLPMALGYVGAWSMPIKPEAEDRVLGTFGTYFRDVREPTKDEMSAVRELASAAAHAIARPPVAM